MKLEIGKVYKFDYVSKSKSSSGEKIKAVMNEDLKEDLIFFINKSKLESITRFQKKFRMTEDMSKTKDKDLIEVMKEDFYKEFPKGSSEDKTPEVNARNLFFRNYNPDNIVEGDSIEALFAGWDCTVNGKITYKWYVLSETKIDAKYFTEDIKHFIKIN
jgi:hypothetical protein